MINKFIGMGYSGSNPEIKKFESGKQKCTFSIGINIGKDTTWIEIECWDRIAENASKYINKGSLVFVEGKLKYSTWKDASGNNRSKLLCVCDFLKILNNKQEANESATEESIDSEKKHNENENSQLSNFDDVPW